MNERSVLIVEDDSRIANILAKTIGKIDNFEVVGIAASANEAIDLLDCFSPELVFLDISLTDSSGLDVIKHIRQDTNAVNICVVMLTAAKDVDVIQKAISYGVFDYILKPIAFSRLNQTLQRYLDYSNRLDENDAFEQEDLDLLFHTSGKTPAKTQTKSTTSPKGIDTITLDKVRQIFGKNPNTPYTAEAMSECVGTSRTTARRYLEFMLTSNEVVADIEYGTVGRPERHYVLSKQ